MTPERWQRAKDLFAQASDCAPAQRAEFLERACEGDDALRTELESLLSSERVASDFLSAPAIRVPDSETVHGEIVPVSGGSRPPHALPAPFGKYELVEFLGGGMSHVYRGRDTVLDRPVAIKILTQEASSLPDAKKRFLQEARIAAKVQHENIVAVFDYGEFEGNPYMVMEYLRGEDLRSVLRNRRLSSPPERLNIALQIAKALHHVHGLGIVHRDIKPENIHVDFQGRVTLMDFGIAKIAGLALTRTGTTMGTPYYMSPEQVNGTPVSPASDVYSFGVLLFELLTGSRGLTGETIEVVFYRILNLPLDAAAMERPGVPREIRDLVLHCTAKNPAQRPQSFAPVMEQLQNALASEPVPQPVIAPRPPIRVVVLSVLALALIALAVGVWFLFPTSTPVPGMIYIPAGTFLAGPDRHPVKLKAFYVDETEVSNADYADFCKVAGCLAQDGAPDLPVVKITIEQARAYAKWKHKRLPSPLEWERAARGKDGALFPWGNSEDPSLANVMDNPSLSEHKLMPVRSFAASPAFQMIGNAWEMVEGEVQPSAGALTRVASLLMPPPTADEPWIEIRGGSYLDQLEDNQGWGSTSVPARYAADNIGFRCVKDP